MVKMKFCNMTVDFVLRQTGILEEERKAERKREREGGDNVGRKIAQDKIKV